MGGLSLPYKAQRCAHPPDAPLSMIHMYEGQVLVHLVSYYDPKPFED